MKKLMIAVAIICAAAISQGAIYNWGFSGNGGEIYQAGTEEYLENGTAFLFLGTVSASDTKFDTSKATLITTGGYDDSVYAFGQVGTNPANMPSHNLITTDGGQAYTLILVDKDGLSSLDGYEGNYFLATGTSAQGAAPGATVTYYGEFLNNAEIYGNSWSTMSAAPEPTSGLLLLIGVAGLALKRRRA